MCPSCFSDPLALLPCLAILTSPTTRHFHHTPRHNASPKLSKEFDASSKTRPALDRGAFPGDTIARDRLAPHPAAQRRTSEEKAKAAAERARAILKAQQDRAQESMGKQGGLADNSLFSEEEALEAQKDVSAAKSTALQREKAKDPDLLENRSFENMSYVLNPRPNARSRWQRRMVIREIVRRGRLTKEVLIARNERSHLSKSHFFKTSVKKLAPLARQIAGKSIDEAILQMRFSVKKAAQDVRQHLIQARNEAIVIKGMGLGSRATEGSTVGAAHAGPLLHDSSIAPALPHENPTKSLKPGVERDETDIYIAQAWVNRGRYGVDLDYRARGQVNIMRPPHTGISVLLKEEKTRTREHADKETKAIKKRMGKNMWTQLPDRPVPRQSQYVLW